jgi:5-hydroxyisourate hydrolase
MTHLSTHVLDLGTGRPGAGIPVRVLDADGRTLASGTTDADGRVKPLYEPLDPGTYTLVFELSAYAPDAFFPEAAIRFVVRDARNHHVPLLLSPYGYSTYRGS